MNPQFEQKVNQTLETATFDPNITVKPSPKQQINRDFNRKLIFIVVGAVFCFAILIIIRGVLLQNPALYQNNSIIGQILNPNDATGLDGLELTEAQAILTDFTSSLTNEYQDLPSSDSRSLLLKTDQSSVIGSLQKDGKFNKIAEVPNIIEMYRYYNDQTYLYAINTPSVSLSELYLNTPGNKPILLKRLDKNQKFIDSHFSIQDKTFYYSFFDENNTVYLQATDLKGNQYQLYKTNFLSTNTKVWNIDTVAGYIYLNQDRECFSLQLRDKVLDSYACEKIKSTNDGNFYWANEGKTGLYQSFDKGEIYRFTRGELERKVLVSKNNGQVVQRLWLSGNNLYYVAGTLEQVGNTLWNISTKDIESVNVTTTEQQVFGIKNMRSDINAIIPFDDLYIITEEFFDQSFLYKYVPNPVFPEPVSYPSSYPDSYPVSFPTVNEEDYYWEKVELGIDYKTIQVLQPQYTFDF